jgi:ketosteroid isomerase-like protein
MRWRRRTSSSTGGRTTPSTRRDLDAFLALCDPDVEFISLLMQVEGGNPYRGHDGVRSWWERLLGISPDFRAEIEELRDLGDLTLARARSHGHGVASEAPMEQTFWQLAEWRRKKVIWWRFARSEAEALESAKLPH